MSDKITGFTVVFKEAVSEDYFEMVKTSLSIIKGVIEVKPVVQGIESFISSAAESNRIKDELITLIRSDFNQSK